MELRMSGKERDRLKIVEAVVERKMKQSEAAVLLKITPRQVGRIVKRWREEGDGGLVHRSRGRPSNRRIGERVKKEAMKQVEEQYRGFGPTLAGEYLAEECGVEVSRETLRKWMMEEGLWRGRRRKVKHRQWRERRMCYGELVQMDTSLHAWFEGRGEEAVLITMIDDATSRTEMRFFRTDSTATNLEMMGLWLRRHGRPVGLYADRASHFKTTRQMSEEEAMEGQEQAQTQIQRALKELGIEYIAAYSPQAKGRVERSFKTTQDRVVKGLRREGIGTIEEANAWLEERFVPLWNRRFTVRASCPSDMHRPLRGYDLRSILSEQGHRRVNNDYTVQFRRELYQIEKKEIQGGLRGSRIVIEERLDGSVKLRWQGRYLKHRKIGKRPQSARGALEGVTSVGLRPPSVTPSKKKRYAPPPDHPWRTGHF